MAGKDQASNTTVGQAGDRGVTLPVALGLPRNALLSMRPVQWTKNLLVFLPLAFVWSLDETGPLGELVLRAIAGGAIFCALSGAVYIVNDVFDREMDRAHPRKSRRPIASGDLPLAAAGTTAAMLLAVSISGSFLLDIGFGIVSVAFLGMNLCYSTFLKRLIILDVMIVSAGYLLRVVAGAFVIDVTISPWLYTTIGLGALFIALGKRFSEIKAAGGSASSQRPVLGQYTQQFLGQLITIASTATLVAYSLYTFTTIEGSNVPENHSMMLTVPFVIFGLFRYLYLVNQTNEAESPELVIIKDKPLVISVLLWAVTAMTVLALNR